ncbi:MAG: hypothetical protein JWP97_3907 [Labilithrix sp.]|nr:hypothetical protein [Labilithrix sp.]
MRFRSFRRFSSFLIVTAVAALGGIVAGGAMTGCEDELNTVRTRGDGGEAGAEGGTGLLSCGVPIPQTYDSPSFAANTSGELALQQAVVSLDAKMKSAEGSAPAAVTTADLSAIFAGGAPSLRSVASAFGQSTIDTYLTQLGDFAPRTWTTADPEGDGGTTSGGRYEGDVIVSATGLALRNATGATLLNASLYNYALGLATGPITGATIDRVAAAYGTTPAFSSLVADGGGPPDVLVAALASKRDDKVSSVPGPYRKIRSSLLVAKAAASDPDKCRADLDGAFRILFLEWEKSTYLGVIYALNQAATSALQVPQVPAKNVAALQSFGEAVGLAQSFKGIPQDRRKITDAQIDALLTRIGATTAYQLITQASTRAVAFNTAFQDIGAVYGLTQTEIEDAKKAY